MRKLRLWGWNDFPIGPRLGLVCLALWCLLHHTAQVLGQWAWFGSGARWWWRGGILCESLTCSEFEGVLIATGGLGHVRPSQGLVCISFHPKDSKKREKSHSAVPSFSFSHPAPSPMLSEGSLHPRSPGKEVSGQWMKQHFKQDWQSHTLRLGPPSTWRPAAGIWYHKCGSRSFLEDPIKSEVNRVPALQPEGCPWSRAVAITGLWIRYTWLQVLASLPLAQWIVLDRIYIGPRACSRKPMGPQSGNSKSTSWQLQDCRLNRQ